MHILIMNVFVVLGMMRLVVSVNHTDDCTYNFTETYPVIYESPEAFIVDFEKLARKTIKEIKWPNFQVFELGGREWDATDFISGKKFKAPDILTLDEWYGSQL